MSRLLTPEEIAEYLGVKKSTIYQWTHTGFIPHVKLSRFVRFDLQQIDKWIKDRSVQGRTTQRVDIRHLGL
mgnify:CR=1 FL=1